MCCSAFVRHCYREAGEDFIGFGIDVSDAIPEDIAQEEIKGGAIKVYRP
jgi:hypothetical protein